MKTFTVEIITIDKYIDEDIKVGETYKVRELKNYWGSMYVIAEEKNGGLMLSPKQCKII